MLLTLMSRQSRRPDWRARTGRLVAIFGRLDPAVDPVKKELARFSVSFGVPEWKTRFADGVDLC